MNRIAAARAAFSRKFASRPLRAAVAVKIAFAIMAANVSFAAAQAVFHKSDSALIVAASVSDVKPFIVPIDATTDATPAQDCRQVIVQVDEGYGVSETVTRTVCRKAL